jgi:hypothetical protein
MQICGPYCALIASATFGPPAWGCTSFKDISAAADDASLHGTGLASALAYAEAEGWLIDSPRKGWRSVTRAGEVIARVK